MTDQLCLLAVCSFCPAQASCQVWNSGCELVRDQPNPIPSPSFQSCAASRQPDLKT